MSENDIDEGSSPYSRLVGERLRSIRLQKNMSLGDVEQRSGEEFKASVLGAYERGERAISVPRLERLAKFYDVGIDQLLPRDPLRVEVGSAAAGQGKPASEARAPVPKDAVARSPQPAQPSQSAGAPRPAQAARADESTFTVRAGAYTTESAARRRLKALEADVKRAKVPPARIDRIQTKDGDTLFAVRIGTFRTRADAETALKRLARKDLAVGAI